MNKKTLFFVAVLSISSAAFAANDNPSQHKGMMAKMDANQDGSVSREEFLASQGVRFSEIDANQDGKATREEMKAHRQKHHEERRGNNQAKGE